VIDAFRFFLGLTPLTTNNVTTALLALQAPFTPRAKILGAYFLASQRSAGALPQNRSDIPAINVVAQYLKPNAFVSNSAPSSLGRVNSFYSPWGGNPFQSSQAPDAYDRTLKDPGVYSPNDWNFPRGESLSANLLGQVHRGTPWQTIYLKAEFAPFSSWQQHAGDFRTHPANDWRFAALVASLLNTTNPRTLLSVNTTNRDAWAAAFGGLTVLSNDIPNSNVFPGRSNHFQTITISSHAPQLATVIDGIERVRASRREGYFTSVADIMTVPEINIASPWLNLTAPQPQWGLTDTAYEALPSQLLALVRADSIGAATVQGERTAMVQFSGSDGFSYAVESSSDLRTWTTLSSPHYSTNGVFTLTLPMTSGAQFFRAVLLP
jgi:hypothetical protein